MAAPLNAAPCDHSATKQKQPQSPAWPPSPRHAAQSGVHGQRQARVPRGRMHAHRVLRKAGRGAHGCACRGPGVQLQAGGSAQQPQPRLLSPRRWAACSSRLPASCTRPPRAPPTAWSPLCPASPQPPTPPRTTLCPASPRLPTQASSSKATSDSRLPAPSPSQHSAPPKHHPTAPGRAGPRCRAPSSEVPSKISRWILGKPKQGSPVPEPRSGKETERDAPQKCRGSIF